MALVKYTAAVDAISGKLNGNVFSKNKGGAYLRSRGQVLNPDTNLQRTVRGAFGAISRMWGQLTQSQREGWNNGAQNFPYQNRLGDTKIYSGKTLFQKLNQNLSAIGEPAIKDIPVKGDVPYIEGDLTMIVKIDEQDQENSEVLFGQILRNGSEDAAYILEATPALSPGVKNANNQFRKIAVHKGETADPLLIDSTDFEGPDGESVYELMQQRFGDYLVGQGVQIRIRVVNAVTGQSGEAFKGSAIAVAV